MWRTRTSWCLLYARLDGHRVVLPSPIPTGATNMVIDARTLSALLDGVARSRIKPTTRDIVKEAREKVQIRAPTSTRKA